MQTDFALLVVTMCPIPPSCTSPFHTWLNRGHLVKLYVATPSPACLCSAMLRFTTWRQLGKIIWFYSLFLTDLNKTYYQKTSLCNWLVKSKANFRQSSQFSFKLILGKNYNLQVKQFARSHLTVYSALWNSRVTT